MPKVVSKWGKSFLLSIGMVFALSLPALANGATELVFLGVLKNDEIVRLSMLFCVIVIETIILKRLLLFSWYKTLISVAVINSISSLIGWLWVQASFTAIYDWNGSILAGFIGIPVNIVIIIVIARVLKPPTWFYFAGYIPLILGAFLLADGSEIIPPFPHPKFLGALAASLVFGFGFTLITETFCGMFVLKRPNLWYALLVANIASYIFLAIAAPFLTPSPAAQYAEIKKHNMHITGVTRGTAYDTLWQASRNGEESFTLDGIEIQLPSEDDPWNSIDEINMEFSWLTPRSDIRRLCESPLALGIPGIDHTNFDEFELMIGYLDLWEPVRHTIMTGNRGNFDYFYPDLVDYYNENLNREFQMIEPIPPEKLTRLAKAYFESDIELPPDLDVQ